MPYDGPMTPESTGYRKEIPYNVFVGELVVGWTLRNADGTRPKIIEIREFFDALGQRTRTIILDNGDCDTVPTSTLITVVSDN